MTRHVLFVCTGNTCRSAMAEALLRRALPAGSAWRVASAGVAAMANAPASEYAAEVLAELGIDLAAHRSQPVTRKRAAEAAVIIAMTRQHVARLCEMFPDTCGRIYLMRSFDPSVHPETDVGDPFCGSLADYRNCRGILQRSIPGILHCLETVEAADAL